MFKTGAGEYWGIEETNMPNPPVLADKSFQHNIKGREFQLYYSGSNLHMIVLRVHDKSYWVVNTLLDSLSNETMIAIAAGLKPLPAEARQVESRAMARVGIFGAGWVGLVTGVCFAELGHEVVIRDVVPEKIEALGLGEVPFHELDVPELLERNRERLTFTLDAAELATARSCSSASTRRRRPRATPISRACGASSTSCPRSRGGRSS